MQNDYLFSFLCALILKMVQFCYVYNISIERFSVSVQHVRYQSITIIIFNACCALKVLWAYHCRILICDVCYSEHLRIQAVLIIDDE